MVADLNVKSAQTVAASISEAGSDALSVNLDVSNPESVNAAFSAAEDWKGRPTAVLVNSAGIIGICSLSDYKFEDWQRVFNINVTGTFLASQRAAHSMAGARYGRIINVASVSAERAGIGRAAYGTSKAAVVGLTRQLAMELGPLGITANAIAPGPVGTAMTAESFTEETIAECSSMIPSRRLGTVYEMADAILFLAARSSGYINGVLLPVDGGYLASGVAKTGSLTN
ncbi:SDR family NAD(P)-dependent oxidoreductase [Paraburkholderia sp. MM5482-R1]|uniref:SDR family NAD(P)-dependent oxidoreductase n=1 Tax=unclassified Paraburkholderia TaxID=2615204 RepID=UPI003D209AE4